MGEHYICTGGCKGVSNTVGVCQSPECKKFHEELTKCDCDDEQHKFK